MSRPKFVVLNLPIEPIDRRYSAQWDVWFRDAFYRNDMETMTCYGCSFTEGGSFVNPDPPSPDKFLDPMGTFRWKYRQLLSALSFIKETGRAKRYVVFLHDGWMPGIEMFPYLNGMDGYDIKVASYWHAGSYDGTDILAKKCKTSGFYGSEAQWMTVISDVVFTGTEYHAKRMQRHFDEFTRGDFHPEIIGYPVEVPKLNLPRRNLVVWPHRLSEDKHPEVFERLRNEPCFEGVEFVRTMDEYRSKQQYYELLASAKVSVSTASHENFGIAMVESAMLGCHPVVPNGLSYKETMEDCCRYDSYGSLKEHVLKALYEPHPYEYPFKDRYDQVKVTDRVCETLRRLGEK